MKEKIKKIVQFIINPRLLLCVALAWMITNGWSYVLFAVGTLCEIYWMAAIGGAYLTFLWLPISPEKIVTAALAIFFLKKFFPKDEKTLAVLREWHAKIKGAVQRKKKEHRKKKEEESKKKQNNANGAE